jgi:chaperonin GroEL (HSP60 family)
MPDIALNAGRNGSAVVGKILDRDTYAFGFDAQSGEYVNMMSKCIMPAGRPSSKASEREVAWHRAAPKG